MTLGRRTSIWLVIGSIVLCSWCTLLSGVGGWLMGHDLGQREMRAQLLPETGVMITRVERGGPAARAGIQRGDTIIAVNGVAVEDVPALRDELWRYKPGDTVALTYRHDLGEGVTQVQLESHPGTQRPYLGIYYTARADEPADL